LMDAPLFAQTPMLLDAVCYLIAHHDDSSYKFPSLVWQGGVGKIGLDRYAVKMAEFAGRLSAAQRHRLHVLLSLLREADALTAAGKDGAERTFLFARSKGLPVFAQGNPLNAWCWEECAIGNVRLAAKRALIDAGTPQGRTIAWESYRATEAYVAMICASEGVGYIPETLSVGDDEVPSFAVDAESLVEITAYADWPTLAHRLHTLNAHDISAPARICRLAVEQLPVVASESASALLQDLVALQSRFVSEYALSLFDLTGILEFRWQNKIYCIAPPMIERPTSEVASAIILLDGAPRAALARQLGINALWMVECAATLPENHALTWQEISVATMQRMTDGRK